MEASNKRQTSLKIKRLVYITKKGVTPFGLTPLSSGFRLTSRRRLPTLPLLRSTIGVTRLNFSVRNGKRWIPRAIATLISLSRF